MDGIQPVIDSLLSRIVINYPPTFERQSSFTLVQAHHYTSKIYNSAKIF